MGPQLLGRLLDEHARALELFARQWCANPADIVQEAFVELIGQRVLPDNVAAWLYRVTRNKAISAARAADRRQRHETAAGALADNWFDPTRSAQLDGEAVTEALTELPAEEREAIVARLWGGLSFEQIAALSDTSSSTAHRRYQAGLSSLRKKLGVPCRTKESKRES